MRKLVLWQESDLERTLKGIIENNTFKSIQSQSKFCDEKWTIKMGGIEEGLKGLTDKMGLDMDNLNFTDVSIQKEVDIFVNDTVKEFIKNLERQKVTIESTHVKQQVDSIISKLEGEIDPHQRQELEIKFVDSFVHRLENDEENQREVTNTIFKLVKKTSTKQVNQDQEVQRAVSNLTSLLRSKLRKQVPDSAQEKLERPILDPKVEELDENMIKELGSKVKQGLKSELFSEVKANVKELKVLELKQDINQLIEDLKASDPDSSLHKYIDHLYDVLEVGYLLHYIRNEKASRKEYPNGTRDRPRRENTL